MQGHLNAIGLLACVAMTALVLLKTSRRKPATFRVLTGVLSGFLTMFAAGAVSVHACDAGQPFTQMLVPSLCLMAVLLFVVRASVRRAAAAALVVAAFVLSLHFSELVHEPGYTGNPGAGGRARIFVMLKLNESLSRETGLPTLLPSGWLRDQLSGSVLHSESEEAYEDLFGRLDHLGKAKHVWHTWLTGIYRTESIPADVWFKGGTPGTDVTQLEVRPRERGI